MSERGYSLFPNRPHGPLLHDEECACKQCVDEMAARQAADRKHKGFILCAVCQQTIRVNRRAGQPIKRSRERALSKHRELGYCEATC